MAKKNVGWLLWLTPFLFSCESDEILSLPQEPGDQNLNLYFTDIPLSYSLVQLDSIFTSRTSNSIDYHLLVGNSRSELFGNVQAQAFTELTLDTRTEVTAEDEFDSLVLILVNDYFYGDASRAADQTIGIYQLADTLARKSHYSQDKAEFLSDPLAEFPLSPNPDVDSSPDTLRIPLVGSLGQNLFDLAQANAETLQTDSAFRLFFPGIALTSPVESGFVAGFNPDLLRLAMYFSTSDETSSTSYTFDISANRAITYNNIEADRSGTPLASLVTEDETFDAQDGGFYLQLGTGLTPVLSLQPVADFIKNIEDSIGNINNSDRSRLRVNRIDLYIGTTPLGEGLPLPEAIVGFGFEEDFSIKSDTNSIGTLIPRVLVADDIQPTRSGLYPIPPTESVFQAQITRHIQSLIDESPITEAELILRSPSSTALGNTLNQIVAEPDSVIAKIYYTLLE
ncbi:MAG: DUF4270 family protein [Cyclobacteriaceae bacterium]